MNGSTPTHSQNPFHVPEAWARGDNSSSPFDDGIESDYKQYNNFAPFFWDLQSQDTSNTRPSYQALSSIATTSSIPGISPKTDLSQFPQLIKTSGSTLATPTQTSSLLCEEEDLFSPEKEKETPKTQNIYPSSSKRKADAPKLHSLPETKRNRIEPSAEQEADAPSLAEPPALISFLTIMPVEMPLRIKAQAKIEHEFNTLRKHYFNRGNDRYSKLRKTKMSDASHHPKKNQNPRDLPYNHTRFFDPRLGEDFYANASLLPDVPDVGPNPFSETQNDIWDNRTILLDDPFEETINDFWHLAFISEARCIVMITTQEAEEAGDVIEYCPPFEKSFKWGSLIIKTETAEDTIFKLPSSGNRVSLRSLSIKHDEENFSPAPTHHFTFTQEKGGKLLNAEDMLHLLKQIQLFSGDKAVLFHSHSCVSENGALLAICHFLLQTHRLHLAKKKWVDINVFNLVVHLRKHCRFGMVQTLEEYQLIHEFLYLLQTTPDRRPSRDESKEERVKYAPYMTPFRI